MGSNRPNIATAAIDAMLSDYIQQCGTPSHNNDALRPEQNADGHSHNSHLRIDTATAFHQPSHSIQLNELLTPGCLFDLPEYDHQDETIAAPPSTQRHPHGSNLFLLNASSSNTAFKSTLSQQRPAASPPPPAATPLPTLLPDAVLSLPFHPPPSTLPAPSPPSLVHLPPQHAPFHPPHKHQSTVTTPDLHALLDDPLRTLAPSRPAFPPLTLARPATITAPLSPDTEALLNDPLTATLIATQLNTTRPRTHRSPDTHTLAAAAAAPPIAKPRRKKLRPKDTIDALQQHLDGITEKIRCLSLRNRQLHKQKLVLDAFVRGLARYQDVAALVKADHEAQGDEAFEPPTHAAALRAWTPDQFVRMYKEHVARVGQWIARVEASASGAPSDADVAELRAATELITQVMLLARHGRTDFIPRVMAQLLKLLPDDLSEEEHWRNVLGAVDLTEGQVEDLLAAREVYLRCSDNVGREHDTAKATLQEATQLVLPMDGNTQVEKVAAQVNRMAAVMRKHQGLATLMFFFWFDTLTPLQMARTLVRAYPLLPSPVIMMNALHSLQGQAPVVPLLGPPPAPLATARTLRDLQQGFLPSKALPPGLT